MKLDDKKWNDIKTLLTSKAFRISYYSVASVNEDGAPHIAPIGSLFLLDNRKGFYFENFPSNMPRNFQHNKNVCVMVVNDNKFLWIKSLLTGKISVPISLRLMGKVGEKRDSTEEERRKWQKIVKPLKWTRGYNLLWKNLKHVREIEFDSYVPVKAGIMTSDLIL